MVKAFSRKGRHEGEPVAERAAADGGGGILGERDAMDGGVVQTDAVPGGDEPWHGKTRMSELGGAPCLAHAAEADAVAQGWRESVEDDAKQVVR
jgi:hypothetical protein